MIKLPQDIEELILDYYWSHRMFSLKQQLHRQIRHVWMLREVHIYYDVYYDTFPQAYMLHGFLPTDDL